MRGFVFALCLVIASASAQVINVNSMEQRASYPTRIGATYNPTMKQLRDDGWRKFVACPSIENSNMVVVGSTDDGKVYEQVCEYTAYMKSEQEIARDALDVALAGRTRKVALTEAKAAMKAEFTAKQFKALKDYFGLKELIDDVKE